MKRMQKVLPLAEAIAAVKSDSRVMVGSFGMCGYPDLLVDALAESDVSGLTVISSDLSSPNQGLGRLLTNGKVKGLIGTYYNWNPDVADNFNAGRITVDVLPQGTFAEAIRAAGAGIPAFYAAAGAGTMLAEGKETRVINGRAYLYRESIPADFALIKAYKADKLGNLIYYKTARNFNPLMAMAAKCVIAQVAEVVEVGELDPEQIVTPHVFVDIVVKEDGAHA